MIKMILKRCLKTKGGKMLLLSILRAQVLTTSSKIDDNILSIVEKLLNNNFDIEKELSELLELTRGIRN